MANPWEQYQQQDGPWSQYATPEEVTPVGQGPFLGGERPAPPYVEPRKTVGDYAKAFLEVPATIVTGAAAPFIGVGAGAIENIVQGTNKRLDRPELAQRFTYQPTSPVSQEVIETLASGLEKSKLPPFIPMAGRLGGAAKVESQVLPSYARAMGQEVVEKAAPIVQNPIVQKGVEMVEKGVENVKQKLTPEPKKYIPSEQALTNIADSAFKRAKDNGVQIDTQKFITGAQDLVSDLRALGYDERAYPKVKSAIDILVDPNMPKDLAELKTIRNFIVAAQKSTDSTEKMLGTVLKQRFDEYLATIPKENLTGGSKEGLRAWKEGQMAYSRLSKSQIFSDMMERAEIDAKNIGIEKSLSNQLDALAKNKNRMRLFTKEEQDMITEAAKGGKVQNTLKFIGKFAPTNTISGFLTGGASMYEPTVGIPFAVGTTGAKMGATQMRKTQIERLAEAMRKNPSAGPEVDFSKPMTPNDRIAEILRRFNQGEQ